MRLKGTPAILRMKRSFRHVFFHLYVRELIHPEPNNKQGQKQNGKSN